MNKQLIAALAAIQNLPLDSEGYGYKYTSLPKILDHVKPVLAKHKLALMQEVSTDLSDGQIGVRSVILGEEGEPYKTPWVSCTTKGLNMKSEAQSLGAVVTYLRRYSLTALLGIAGDEDTDAAPAKQKPAPKPKAIPKNAPTEKSFKALQAKLSEAFGKDRDAARKFYTDLGLPNSTTKFTQQDVAHCIEQLASLADVRKRANKDDLRYGDS